MLVCLSKDLKIISGVCVTGPFKDNQYIIVVNVAVPVSRGLE